MKDSEDASIGVTVGIKRQIAQIKREEEKATGYPIAYRHIVQRLIDSYREQQEARKIESPPIYARTGNQALAVGAV